MNETSQQTPPPSPRRWYMQWWGILLVLFLVIFGISTIFFFVGLIGAQTRQATNPLSSFSTTEFTDSGLAAPVNDSGMDVVTDDDPFIGNPDAKLTIVAFEDFQCPFCGRMFPIIREIVLKYEDRVKFIYRDFPVVDIHPEAMISAQAAECADDQGKFWPFHDRLFQNQGELGRAALDRYAQQVGLDMLQFGTCLDTEQYRDEVIEDLNAGFEAGVRGTPTFFLNGFKIEGALPADLFEQAIQQFVGPVE